MKKFFKQKHSGFTLVEMVIYLALMTAISIVLVRSLVLVFNSNRAAFAEMNLRNAAYSAMENMVREIRGSISIDSADSTLYPSQAGILALNQTDGNGNPIVVEFATSSSGALDISRGAAPPALVGPVTGNGAQVAALVFTPITTKNSTAVRIALELSASVNGATQTQWFYDTAILRNSY
ncbi:MAG: prepilin-type N-terminal cleavage/methylation domain-containing protein [Patescibacteria group bacterium]|nr:prepilin-type N-terminal cleavage/methylation domain-containing protein [Patescibacteria group bacterium]MDE1945785.1 prepilin-type N-terminal cleavage/methylation domain-containing protein [Patescibacteria group bacterium]